MEISKLLLMEIKKKERYTNGISKVTVSVDMCRALCIVV